jgi:hypothetical protein
MNQNINFKTLDEKKKELASLKAEWEDMKEQEKKLKEKFYSSPFEKRAQMKGELKTLQDAIFEKGNCGKSTRIDTRNEEMIQKLKNPVGPATDPQHLANLIKEELRATLDGRQKFKAGNVTGDIWEANQSREICYFGRNKEINELIANLARNRQTPLNPDKITSRMVRVKQKDFSSADFSEMISLVRQVKEFLEEQYKQERQRTENIKLNNPHLFTQWRCSTDGKYNGRGRWENWHTFSGKRNGHNYTIYVPDNHIALTNVLFNNGWGTNSEVRKFFVVEGVPEPTTLHYWNVDQQRYEIISETEAQRLEQQGKGAYIEYKTYVELNDKISIDHYKENGSQQELTKPVSGANKLVNSTHKNMNGGAIARKQERKNLQLDNKFLLKYFREQEIKQIQLTPEGNLLIEYNKGKSEVIFKKQANNSEELQKVIGYYQKNNQTNLSREDLINMVNSNSPTTSSNNNNGSLVAFGIGGSLIIGIIIGLWLRKNKVKKG